MQRNNLIVNYLPPSYRDLDLRKLFLPYGNIIHAKVICSKATNESLTYGFVMFEKDEDAYRAVHEVNGLFVCGKQLKVSFARPRDIGGKGCKLHVSKLPPHYSWEMVNNLFAPYGNIIELRVLADENGNSRQVAFVQYSERHESDEALSALSGYIPPGGDVGLVIKYATQHKSKSAKNDFDDLNFDYLSLSSTGHHMTPPDQSPRFGITTDSSIPWTMPQSVPQYAGYQNWMMAVPDANPSVSSQFITERPRSLPPWNGDQSPQQQHPFNPTSGGPSSSAFQSQSQFRSGFEADPDLRAYLPQNPSRPILPPQTAAADNPLRVRTAISDSPLTTSESSSSSSSTTPLPQSHRSGQHMNPTTISSAPPSSSGASRSISSSDSVDFLIGKDYILTLQHIKPYQDVLSFPFVTSFGKVLEGKFVELTLPSQEKLYSIQYVIQPLSSRNLQQFQYFQNSSILYEGSTLNLFIEESRK